MLSGWPAWIKANVPLDTAHGKTDNRGRTGATQRICPARAKEARHGQPRLESGPSSRATNRRRFLKRGVALAGLIAGAGAQFNDNRSMSSGRQPFL
jgi:hypothetical protein